MCVNNLADSLFQCYYNYLFRIFPLSSEIKYISYNQKWFHNSPLTILPFCKKQVYLPRLLAYTKKSWTQLRSPMNHRGNPVRWRHPNRSNSVTSFYELLYKHMVTFTISNTTLVSSYYYFFCVSRSVATTQFVYIFISLYYLLASTIWLTSVLRDV